MNMLLGALALASTVVAAVLFHLWRHEERYKELHWQDFLTEQRRASAAELQTTTLAVAVRGVLDLKDGALIYRAFRERERLAALAREIIVDRETMVFGTRSTGHAHPAIEPESTSIRMGDDGAADLFKSEGVA